MLVQSVLKTSIWQRCISALLVGGLLLVACSPAPSGMVATDVNQLAAFEALTGVAAYVPADAEDLGAIALAEQAAAAAAPETAAPRLRTDFCSKSIVNEIDGLSNILISVIQKILRLGRDQSANCSAKRNDCDKDAHEH